MRHPSQTKKHESWDIFFPVEDEEELYNTTLYVHNAYDYLFNGKVGVPIREKLQNGAKVLEFW